MVNSSFQQQFYHLNDFNRNMYNVKILVPIHTKPDVQSVTTIFFENLLPTLKQRINVDMIWFVYQPDKINFSSYEIPNSTIVDIHNYNNAVQVLQQQKPDLVFANSDYGFINYAFSLAAKFLKIPVISVFYTDVSIPRGRSKLIKSYVNRFFDSTVPTDRNTEPKQNMRRGRFFIYKFGFLLRTQNSIKWNVIKIIKNILMILSKIFQSEHDFQHDKRFANTLHLLYGSSLVEPLVKAGYERSTLVVTGNPMFDPLYEKIKSLEVKNKKDLKIRVLLLTTSLYEHGYWTKEQRDVIITDIVSKISSSKKDMSLAIKIHPSSENLSEYSELVRNVDSTVSIYQTGDILNFINESDVIVSFQSSSTLIYSLLLNKPVISCDFFGLGNDVLVEKGFAVNCKSSSDLIELIKQVYANNPIQKGKLDEFISEFLCAFDGKCAERVSDEIMKLLDGNKPSQEI